MNADSSTKAIASELDLDGLLASHPFGNTDYITEQMHIAFKRRLSKLSHSMDEAGGLLAAIERSSPNCQYRIFGDMVVRCAIQQAFRQMETGAQYGLPTEMCKSIFSETMRQVQDGIYGPLGSALEARLGPGSHDAWIWRADRPDDVFVQAFHQV